MYKPVSASVEATSLVVGVRYGSPERTWFYAAAAAPLDEVAAPWGAVGVTRRLPLGTARALRVGLDGGAHGYVHRDRIAEETGTGATLDAAAWAGAALGAITVELRSGARQYLARLGEVRASRTSWDTSLRLEAPLGTVVPGRVGAAARWTRAAEGGYPSAGVDVSALLGPVQLTLTAEQWFASDLRDTGWSAAASMPLGFADAWVALRRETRDPLYWNVAGRSWSAGLSRRLGPSRTTVLPVASVQGGRAIVRIPRVAARGPISLAGDFTGWETRPMRLAGDVWELDVALSSGVYHYAFVDGSGRWFVPAETPGRMDDGMGGHVAVLVVP